jgi:hypothetical protein
VRRAFPWAVLGIAPTADIAAIRRAYAVHLKAMDPDLDADAYAQLRQARDAALRQARAKVSTDAAAGDEAETLHGDAPSGSAEIVRWPYAAPEVVIAGSAYLPAVTVATPSADDDYRRLAEGFSPTDPSTTGDLQIGKVFGAPVLSGGTQAEDLRPVQRPDARLSALLLAAETPLSAADEDEARTCLREVLGDAAAGNLARHNAAEAWLSELLARSWPRCAPLLEEAATAMGWTNSAGRLGESKAVAFLNHRLAGYLFQRDVQQPSHPFHQAWVELSRPARAGPIRLVPLRVNPLKQQIRDLLQLIQRQFPEIESFLDPQRVASWETAMPTGRHYVFRVGRHYTFRIRWLGIAAFVAFRLLIALSQCTPQPQTPSTSPASQFAADPRMTLALDSAISSAFGQGKTMAWLRARQPDLADRISAQAWPPGYDPANLGYLIARVEREVRRRVDIAARTATGADLDDAMRVRAGLIDTARGAGGPACTEFLATGFLPDTIEPPAKLRSQEQALAAHLVELGKLTDQPPPPPARVKVPGKLVEQVIVATGLSHDRVVKALTGTSIDQDRCVVEDSLLKATLAWHGKDRTAILRIF